jgi:SAM-dependent methyltransferase
VKISHKESLPYTRYLEDKKDITLADYAGNFKGILADIQKFKKIDSDTNILEVGCGTGWFQLLCKKNNIRCKGIDISPQLIDYCYSFGKRYDLVPDIELANIEDADIGADKYDIIIASSVFEHVEYWQNGITNIYKALKKGGLFYFVSTNKFTITLSGEYKLPFYGLLPNKLRRYLLIKREGEDIARLGIDFNQFNYFQLKLFFKRIGFTTVHDFTEFIDTKSLNVDWKRLVFNSVKYIKPVKYCILLFAPVTYFICIK